jgi:hypothetical protein
MASVKVSIDSRSVFQAVGTPGGPVYEWRDQTAKAITNRATATAPVNNPLNAAHRGGGVGEFKRSFDWDRWGNQYAIGAIIFNTSSHAVYAEFGRGPSQKVNAFAGDETAGKQIVVRAGASGWPGNHTLRDAANAVGAATGDYSPTL